MCEFEILSGPRSLVNGFMWRSKTCRPFPIMRWSAKYASRRHLCEIKWSNCIKMGSTPTLLTIGALISYNAHQCLPLQLLKFNHSPGSPLNRDLIFWSMDGSVFQRPSLLRIYNGSQEMCGLGWVMTRTICRHGSKKGWGCGGTWHIRAWDNSYLDSYAQTSRDSMERVYAKGLGCHL